MSFPSQDNIFSQLIPSYVTSIMHHYHQLLKTVQQPKLTIIGRLSELFGIADVNIFNNCLLFFNKIVSFII